MTVWQKLVRRPRAQTPSPRKAPLLLEPLEHRCVPATFFVNVNGGSDANDGSPGAPFAAIQAAGLGAQQFASGQRAPQQDNNPILVAAGTYGGTALPNDATTL